MIFYFKVWFVYWSNIFDNARQGIMSSSCLLLEQQPKAKARREPARGVFMKMRSLLCHRDLSFQLPMRVARCYVLSVLLYGLERWILLPRSNLCLISVTEIRSCLHCVVPLALLRSITASTKYPMPQLVRSPIYWLKHTKTPQFISNNNKNIFLKKTKNWIIPIFEKYKLRRGEEQRESTVTPFKEN